VGNRKLTKPVNLQNTVLSAKSLCFPAFGFFTLVFDTGSSVVFEASPPPGLFAQSVRNYGYPRGWISSLAVVRRITASQKTGSRAEAAVPLQVMICFRSCGQWLRG
jgi:hypothetical protein